MDNRADDLLDESDEDEAEFLRPEEYRDNSRADHEDENPADLQHYRTSLSGGGNEHTNSDGSEGEIGQARPRRGTQSASRSQARDQLPNLPPIPEFMPLSQPAERHQQQAQLPPEFNSGAVVGPLDYFRLFFDDGLFACLADNTNTYAATKGAGRPGSHPWKPTSVAELKIFFGIIIYMGVFPSAQVGDYWSRDSQFPFHRIGMYISQNRFEQLKRYFHISPPYNSLPRSQWYQKLQPLADILSARFRTYFLPASDVAVDEMMVRFTGRSAHTILLRGKPIPQGYKILALCDHGYTYSYIFTSRTDSFVEVNQHLYQGHRALSPTSRAVYQLVRVVALSSWRVASCT